MSNFEDEDRSNWFMQWSGSLNKLTADIECDDTIAISSLTIDRAEVMRSFMQKYVVYNIDIKPNAYSIARRFNDFRWLRDELSNTYVGLFVPVLPTTYSMHLAKNHDKDKTDIKSDFVLNRKLQLNMWLQQLLSIPFIRSHPAWHLFFSVGRSSQDFAQFTRSHPQGSMCTSRSGRLMPQYLRTPAPTLTPNTPSPLPEAVAIDSSGDAMFEFAPVSDQPPQPPHYQNDVDMSRRDTVVEPHFNLGFEIWHHVCDASVSDIVPGERDGVISDFKRQLFVLLQSLTKMEYLSRRATEKALKNTRAAIRFAECVRQWQAVEQGLHDEAHAVFISDRGQEMLQSIAALAVGSGHWAYNSSFMPKLLSRYVLCAIQYQIDQTQGMVAHIKTHESLLAALGKAERALESAQSAHTKAVAREKAEAGTAGGGRKSINQYFQSSAIDLEAKVGRKTEAVFDLRAAVSLSTKALLFCEMQRFSGERIKSVTRLLGMASSTVLQILECAQSDCAEIMSMGRVSSALYAYAYGDLTKDATNPMVEGDQSDNDDVGAESADADAAARVLNHSRAARNSRAGFAGGGSKTSASLRADVLTAGLGCSDGAGGGSSGSGVDSSTTTGAGAGRRSAATNTRECMVCTKRVPRTYGLECCSAGLATAPGQHEQTGVMSVQHFMCDSCFSGNYMEYQLSEEYRSTLIDHDCHIVCLKCAPRLVTPFKMHDVARHCDGEIFDLYMEVCDKLRSEQIDVRARELAVQLRREEKSKVMEESLCIVCYEKQSDAIIIHDGSGHVCCCFE